MDTKAFRLEPDQTRTLVELLSKLFDRREFLRFVEDLAGAKIAQDLPTSGPLASFLEASIQALERRSLIDERFFDLLVEERPRSAAAIRLFQERLSSAHETGRKYEYDFFISHGRDTTRDALELYRLLSRDARVFVDLVDLVAGQRWDTALQQAISRSRIIVFLISSDNDLSRFQQEEIALAIDLSRRRRNGVRIVPVFLSKESLAVVPYGLDSYHGFIVPNEGGIAGVAKRLREVRGQTEPEAGGISALFRKLFERSEPVPPRVRGLESSPVDLQLRDLTQQFFAAAGRTPLTRDINELAVPEPALIASDVPSSPTDVRSLSRLLGPNQVGYFLYKDGLPERTLLALDELRVRGNAIVPIAANAMAAALADGTARAILSQLDSDYRSRDNLFETRNAIIDERFFFGRHDLLAQVGSALARGEHIMVFGLRKAGKTSLLNILRQHLSDHPFFVADLEKYDRHEEDWPRLLFTHVVQAFDQWGHAKFGDWPGKSETLANASELESSLSVRRRWQLDRGRDERFVIVLDEIERVFPALGEEEPAKKFIRAAGALRSLGQSGADRFISIIAADLRPEANRANRLGRAGTNPFFNFFQEVPLPLLSRGAIDEMMTSIGRAMGIDTVDSDFLDRLFKLAGGHPFISRLIAGASWRRRTGDRARLALDDLELGLAELQDRDTLGSFFRENLWGELRAAERSLLWNAVSNGGDVVRSRRSGVTAEKAFLSALGLFHEGQLPIGLFADWIADGAI